MAGGAGPTPGTVLIERRPAVAVDIPRQQAGRRSCGEAYRDPGRRSSARTGGRRLVAGRGVVEWIEGDAAWAIIDRISTKYTGAPYSRGQERVVAVIEPERQTVGVG
ncbi:MULTISPECIES: hypothetical protein [unclassified Streptomyces]|uniref:hypothetical protein n=1 Tax=unclassified Streptomyces TaxID=2593676 RepID=UPI0019443785|nr:MULTISPECIES: hypothetical protein [unclassified Streptomyces]